MLSLSDKKVKVYSQGAVLGKKILIMKKIASKSINFLQDTLLL
jgi:hypothetical protein